MNRHILIFGGTQYFGKHLVNKLLANGDRVYISTRGNNPILSQCSFIHFDRDGNESFISKQNWDVVYDQNCYKAVQLNHILPIIAQCGTYVFTSSQAAYPSGLALNEEMHDCTDSLINHYGLEKRQAERLLKSQTTQAICPRFPVVIGENDPRKRLQNLLKKIHTGTIQLPINNPLLQFIDEHDAANILFELPLKNFYGTINIAAPLSISAQYLCEFLAKVLAINLKITWCDHYYAEPFDLIKTTSKTMSLQKQQQLGLTLQDPLTTLRGYCHSFRQSHSLENPSCL